MPLLPHPAHKGLSVCGELEPGRRGVLTLSMMAEPWGRGISKGSDLLPREPSSPPGLSHHRHPWGGAVGRGARPATAATTPQRRDGRLLLCPRPPSLPSPRPPAPILTVPPVPVPSPPPARPSRPRPRPAVPGAGAPWRRAGRAGRGAARRRKRGRRVSTVSLRAGRPQAPSAVGQIHPPRFASRRVAPRRAVKWRRRAAVAMARGAGPALAALLGLVLAVLSRAEPAAGE